jgi:hypothetical protein
MQRTFAHAPSPALQGMKVEMRTTFQGSNGSIKGAACHELKANIINTVLTCSSTITATAVIDAFSPFGIFIVGLVPCQAFYVMSVTAPMPAWLRL